MSIMTGKKVGDYVAQTFTNFGDPGRRVEVGKHYSIESAIRQGKRYWQRIAGKQGDHVWTMKRHGVQGPEGTGCEILFDSHVEQGITYGRTRGQVTDWEEDRELSSEAWLSVVAAGDTRLGYQDWCWQMKREAAEEITDGTTTEGLE
jgi:hypothetical protein